MLSQNSHLRTRVSELEVINDLFRGRVAELENSENDARRTERARDEDNMRLKAELDAAERRTAELQRRVEEMEDSEPARKRTRRSSGEEDSSVPIDAAREVRMPPGQSNHMIP